MFPKACTETDFLTKVQLKLPSNLEMTEEQNCRGWKSPLELVQSKALLKAQSDEISHSGPCPVGF